MKHSKIKIIAMTGMLSAVAFVAAYLSNLVPIKVMGFLSYDPKDIIIAIGGFILGPIPALIMTLISALLELASSPTGTGFIGFVMNVLSSVAFAFTAAFIYQKKRTFGGAIIALICGTVAMCATMLLWNYFITPLYMNESRENIAKVLPTVFLPFNLIKGVLNASITIVLYKPTVKALRKARLVEGTNATDTKLGTFDVVARVIICLLVATSCVFAFLAMAGVL